MITKVNATLSYLKNIWVETFLNKTNKVSDITENSVLNASAFATAKVGQKALKEVAIVESQIFPETASGTYLDRSASLFGVFPRYGALGSSTYIRVYAEPDTKYEEGVHTFVSNNGVRFSVEKSHTVDSSGYGYIKVRSIGTGSHTNVDANSITSVTPVPIGHHECTNEYFATGGRDVEDDEVFRQRILNHHNIHATATLEKLTQVFQNIDNRILRVVYVGSMEDGCLHIQIVTQNGQELLFNELKTILEKSAPYFGIADLTLSGSLAGVKLENAEWHEVGGQNGIDFRCEIEAGYDVSTVRKNIQVGISKYLDFRFWKIGQRIEWDNLLDIVKNTEGVRYVASEWFYPSSDEIVSEFMLPRCKKFVMRDLEGNILFDSSSNFSPVFYPSI